MKTSCPKDRRSFANKKIGKLSQDKINNKKRLGVSQNKSIPVQDFYLIFKNICPANINFDSIEEYNYELTSGKIWWFPSKWLVEK